MMRASINPDTSTHAGRTCCGQQPPKKTEPTSHRDPWNCGYHVNRSMRPLFEIAPAARSASTCAKDLRVGGTTPRREPEERIWPPYVSNLCKTKNTSNCPVTHSALTACKGMSMPVKPSANKIDEERCSCITLHALMLLVHHLGTNRIHTWSIARLEKDGLNTL